MWPQSGAAPSSGSKCCLSSIVYPCDHGVELRLRLGLNTGLVVVGRIGDDLRMDYTAVSYARMLQAQGEGEKARTYLVQAIDLFRQMGMTWDLVRAEQALHSIS